jgi:integrase
MAGGMAMKRTMQSKVQAYLNRRRGLGYQLRETGRLLLDFARYSDHCGEHGVLRNESAIRWASLPKDVDPAYRARRMQTVRLFARYQAALEPATQIPPRHLFGPAHPRKRPHIFTAGDLRHLLRRAGRLSGRLRPRTYRTLIGLLACSGLRISEALNLTVADVDRDKGVLRVGQSKFRHSRLVPLHASATRRLRDYAKHRSREFPQAKHFFVSDCGLALPYSTVIDVFRDIARELPSSNHRPHVRLHDLRHTFACRVLLKWQRNTRGTAGKMVILSRYLGHMSPEESYWYLSAIPQLFRQAAKRFAPPSL